MKTAATFPVIDGVRWSVPGDHARIEDDGTITVLGRGSVSINTGGEKVYPEEVEAALKSHPAVFDAVVVGVPDERWGERVAAVVQPRPGATPALEELAEHVRAQLAAYKAPRDLVLVDAIVRSPSGKPDYRWARAVAVEGERGRRRAPRCRSTRSDRRRPTGPMPPAARSPGAWPGSPAPARWRRRARAARPTPPRRRSRARRRVPARRPRRRPRRGARRRGPPPTRAR